MKISYDLVIISNRLMIWVLLLIIIMFLIMFLKMMILIMLFLKKYTLIMRMLTY